MKPIAIQIGAGNIGRGFLAQLYWQSGFETHFIDADPTLVEKLNAAESYAIEIAVEPAVPDIVISEFRAHLPDNEDAIAEAFKCAAIASVSAGVAARQPVARMLAKAIGARLSANTDPINILVCENPPGEASELQLMVRGLLDVEHHSTFDSLVGFVDTVIGRMVPVSDNPNSLNVRVEAYCELPIDRDAIRGQLPALTHVHAESPFDFWIDRKLFMHNAAHAVAAYAGYPYGVRYVHQAMEIEAVHHLVEQALEETGSALSIQYGRDKESLAAHASDLATRFSNPALRDTIERVARDPLRKLSASERFVRAASCCLEHGVEPRALAVAAAAAIRYDPPSDSGAQAVQERIRTGGVDAVLRDVCGLDAANSFGALIKEALQRINPGATQNT